MRYLVQISTWPLGILGHGAGGTHQRHGVLLVTAGNDLEDALSKLLRLAAERRFHSAENVFRTVAIALIAEGRQILARIGLGCLALRPTPRRALSA